jgi:AbiU2
VSITRTQIEDLVKSGLVADIFGMETSYSLLKAIGTNASVINAPGAGNFGELFGALQKSLRTEAILAVARLYDPPSRRYPTRCIKGLPDYLETNADNLPPIRELFNLKQELTRIGMSDDRILLASSDEKAFAKALSQHFKAILNDPQTLETINKLKDIRDKSIAHNEQTTQITGPTWSGLEKLIGHAKDLTGVLGWAYLSTAYVINGEYILTSDAELPSRAMNRLLRKVITSVS